MPQADTHTFTLFLVGCQNFLHSRLSYQARLRDLRPALPGSDSRDDSLLCRAPHSVALECELQALPSRVALGSVADRV